MTQSGRDSIVPADAILAPRWNPFHGLDGIESFAAQFVDADEELLDIAEDNRGFRAPAIRIRMMKLFFAEKHPALAKQFDNVGVRVENVLAGQIRQTSFIGEPAVIIDWR